MAMTRSATDLVASPGAASEGVLATSGRSA